jgi:hypothetical protein
MQGTQMERYYVGNNITEMVRSEIGSKLCNLGRTYIAGI